MRDENPENVCGGSDVELGLMKIVGIFSKAHYKTVKSRPYRGGSCVQQDWDGFIVPH